MTGDVINKGADGRPRQEVYFTVNEVLANGDHDRGLPNAFFGAYVSYSKAGDLAINKYDNEPYQYGIAYSWTNSSATDRYTVITFCTTEEYDKHQHC